MGWIERLTLRSGDKLSSSSYGQPIFRNVQLTSHMGKYDFIKVRVVEASINIDLDDLFTSQLLVNVVNKAPINQTRGTGTGSTVGYELACVPFLAEDKVASSNQALFTLQHAPPCSSYLIFPKNEFHFSDLELRITDATGTALITAPAGTYLGWNITLSIEGCNQEDLE